MTYIPEKYAIQDIEPKFLNINMHYDIPDGMDTEGNFELFK